MKLEDKVISLEIAKKFVKLGLRNITSENVYIICGDSHYLRKRATAYIEPSFTIYPAYDVAELGEMLPSIEIPNELFISKMFKWEEHLSEWVKTKGMCHCSCHPRGAVFEVMINPNLFAEFILWLVENNHVTVEELNR